MNLMTKLAVAQTINASAAQALADRAERFRQLAEREQEINAEFEQRSLVAEWHRRRQMGGVRRER